MRELQKQLSRELFFPWMFLKVNIQISTSLLYVYCECMCVRILHTYLFITTHSALGSTSEDAVVHTLGAILKD